MEGFKERNNALFSINYLFYLNKLFLLFMIPVSYFPFNISFTTQDRRFKISVVDFADQNHGIQNSKL